MRGGCGNSGDEQLMWICGCRPARSPVNGGPAHAWSVEGSGTRGQEGHFHGDPTQAVSQLLAEVDDEHQAWRA
jgi:hypothetical protein